MITMTYSQVFNVLCCGIVVGELLALALDGVVSALFKLVHGSTPDNAHEN